MIASVKVEAHARQTPALLFEGAGANAMAMNQMRTAGSVGSCSRVGAVKGGLVNS